MRVTFVALTYAPSVGGAQTYVRHVAEGLAARGHSVRVITTDALRTPGAADPGRVEPACETIGGVEVRRFGTRGPLGVLNRVVRRVITRMGIPHRTGRWARAITGQLYVPMSIPMAVAVRRAFRTDDVVVGCSAPFLTLVVPPHLRGRASGAAVSVPLLHLESGAPHGTVARALRRCDGVTAATTFERSAQVALGVEPARVALLPPGIDADAFAEVDPPAARAALGLPERPTVGYLGRLAAYKGVDTLLAAAPMLWEAQEDLTVLVAGSPAGWVGYDAAVARARAHGGDRLVERLGFSDHDRPLLYAACDVVVYPSSEESFGLVILEAWAARRPVVAAGIGAVSDVVRAGVDGLLVPPADPPALAAAVARLLADEETRRAMGAAGRLRAEGPLAWPTIIDGWEAFLAESVAHRRRARGVAP